MEIETADSTTCPDVQQFVIKGSNTIDRAKIHRFYSFGRANDDWKLVIHGCMFDSFGACSFNFGYLRKDAWIERKSLQKRMLYRLGDWLTEVAQR